MSNLSNFSRVKEWQEKLRPYRVCIKQRFKQNLGNIARNCALITFLLVTLNMCSPVATCFSASLCVRLPKENETNVERTVKPESIQQLL